MPPEFRYFKPEEVEGLDTEFVSKLDQARHLAGFPFVITSGFRSPEKNQSVIGAVPNSSHLEGLAVDLKVENDHEVFLLISSAFAVGINRFGIYVNQENVPTHVHLDVSKDDAHVPEVIWIKREGQANSVTATA